MAHRYHSYTDSANSEDVGKSLANRLRYLAMAFRPAGVLIFCVVLTILISVPCALIMLGSPQASGQYAVAMAILTGVIASGLVSITIELANNYRHNRQRFVVLNEYLYMVSMYERFIEWGSHGNYESFDRQTEIDWTAEGCELTKRMNAVAEVILDFGPVIEKAVIDGKEYMSIKELQTATKAVDAADKLGEVVGSIINNHLKSRGHDIYDVLDDPLRERICAFSDEVQIYLVSNDVESVVCDYLLTNLDDLLTLSDNGFVNSMDRLDRGRIIHCLWNFDQAMHELQRFAKYEPVVHENLVPFETRMEKMERKIFGKDCERILQERENKRL